MMAFPDILLAIALVAALGPSLTTVIIALAVVYSPRLARIVRANVLSLKEMDYISASRALGVSDARIIFKHLLPNTIAPIIVSSTLGVANAITSEAYVSFLGLGVQTPTASWGNMLDSAVKYLQTAPWLWLFPGLMIMLTVLCINFIGDGLRDALDPRSARNI